MSCHGELRARYNQTEPKLSECAYRCTSMSVSWSYICLFAILTKCVYRHSYIYTYRHMQTTQNSVKQQLSFTVTYRQILVSFPQFSSSNRLNSLNWYWSIRSSFYNSVPQYLFTVLHTDQRPWTNTGPQVHYPTSTAQLHVTFIPFLMQVEKLELILINKFIILPFSCDLQGWLGIKNQLLTDFYPFPHAGWRYWTGTDPQVHYSAIQAHVTFIWFLIPKKSETELTASVLKKDPKHKRD